MNIQKIKIHFILSFKSLLRQPSYIVSTLAFPSIFFLFFAHPNADTEAKANLLMASFSGFAVLGVLLLDFGVATSKEKATNWFHYLRTLPIKNWQMFVGRSLTAILFSLLSAWLVVAVVLASTPAKISILQFLGLNSALILGGLPFAMMGLVIGYWVKAEAALPVTNLLYLSLSYIGGMWIPPNALPEKLTWLSEIVPTRFYGEALWYSVLDRSWDWQWVSSLSVYFVTASLLAVWGYRRAV